MLGGFGLCGSWSVFEIWFGVFVILLFGTILAPKKFDLFGLGRLLDHAPVGDANESHYRPPIS